MAEPDFESEQQPAVVAAPPALREPPAIRRTSSMDNPGRDGGAPSGLELKRFVQRTMSDSGGVNPLEAWRDERCRARRYRERPTRPATAAAGERSGQSNESKRIRPMVCAGESDAEEAKSSRMGDDDDDEEEEEYRSSPVSMNGFPAKVRPKARKAWKSGSMLVRPRADNGSERVARTMYIYLVGNQKMEVELLVGPPGSQLSKVGEKNTVVRTMMSAGKHVCIPEHKTYLVRNMSDKRTAVLFWASPNETTSAPAEEKKKERSEKDDVRATLARFFPIPA